MGATGSAIVCGARTLRPGDSGWCANRDVVVTCKLADDQLNLEATSGALGRPWNRCCLLEVTFRCELVIPISFVGWCLARIDIVVFVLIPIFNMS
jgi:hypothetical protein